MANFLIAYNNILQVEGGYVNDPDDPGGETYKGISRRFNPAWSGWKFIDKMKKLSNFPKSLNSSDTLYAMTQIFFKENYWDIISLDKINNQFLAEEIYDISVNQSPRDAAKSAQRAVNIVNQNEKPYNDINVDGQIGPQTIGLLNGFLDSKYLTIIINLLQASEYIIEAERNHKQEKFLKGWILNRVVPAIKLLA